MYEFECPNCGGINIRNEENKHNNVCDFCDTELENIELIIKKEESNDEEINIDFSKMTTYGSGQYLVGSDIPSGEYLFIADNYGQGYFCISSDANGNNIISNEYGMTYDYIYVNNGEFLQLQNSKIYNLKDNKLDNIGLDWEVTDCGVTFRVGLDIAPGTYKVYKESGGYYAIYNRPKGRNGQLVNNNFFNGQCYVTVSNGQYLSLSNGTKLI